MAVRLACLPSGCGRENFGGNMQSRGRRFFLALPVLLMASSILLQAAATLGTLRGIVHDPQHRPIPKAQLVLLRQGEKRSWKAQSNGQGEFEIGNIPPGEYTITVAAPGFQKFTETIQVNSGLSPVVHLQMQLRTLQQQVKVSGAPAKLNTQSATTRSQVSAQEISHTPGATVVHDQLHIRGGHQVSWLVDGVPVPNTNIASNVAPLVDPRNIESLEVERGGYSAEYGDRTYGLLNVITPSGFDRNNQGELTLSYGSFH